MTLVKGTKETTYVNNIP